MSGVYANINKTIKEINEMVELYKLDHLRVVYFVDPENGRLTQEMVIEISNKIKMLNCEISKCDKELGRLDVKTLPSSELTRTRKDWEKKKQDLLQVRERMEFVRNNELAILGQMNEKSFSSPI